MPANFILSAYDMISLQLRLRTENLANDHWYFGTGSIKVVSNPVKLRTDPCGIMDHAHKTNAARQRDGARVGCRDDVIPALFNSTGIHGQYNNMKLCKKEEEVRKDDTFPPCVGQFKLPVYSYCFIFYKYKIYSMSKSRFIAIPSSFKWMQSSFWDPTVCTIIWKWARHRRKPAPPGWYIRWFARSLARRSKMVKFTKVFNCLTRLWIKWPFIFPIFCEK